MSNTMIDAMERTKKQRDHEYYLLNREKIIQRSRLHQLSRKEYRKKYMSEYRLANKERLRELAKLYYETHSEAIKTKANIWRRTDKGRECERNKQITRRRTKKQTTDITSDFLVMLKKNTPECSICKIIMTDDNNVDHQFNLDHIVPLCCGGTHSRDNVRFVCRKCNLARPIDGSDLRSMICQVAAN